jgi:hypothetical protein
MGLTYDDAVEALYQAPHDRFVAERKRLASELKGGGDGAAAARLAKLARPTISAWAVNQLWWRAQAAFAELLDSAERLRKGDLAASREHREALTKLRARAAAVLGDAGHAASAATLRRVTTTLSALAAAGGFDPEPPGALTADRDPPGFESSGMDFDALSAALGAAAASKSANASARAPAEPARRSQAQVEQRRAEEERRRRDEERARTQMERRRIELALQSAKAKMEQRADEVERLRVELSAAEDELAEARAKIKELQGRLAELR